MKKNLLYITAALLLVVWATGFIWFNATPIIHILFVIAVISVLLRVIQGGSTTSEDDKDAAKVEESPPLAPIVKNITWSIAVSNNNTDKERWYTSDNDYGLYHSWKTDQATNKRDDALQIYQKMNREGVKMILLCTLLQHSIVKLENKEITISVEEQIADKQKQSNK